MSKQDQLSYVNALHDLMYNIETNAGANRPKWIAEEYKRAYAEFRATVEKDNETRNGKVDAERPQAGADQSPYQP